MQLLDGAGYVSPDVFDRLAAEVAAAPESPGADEAVALAGDLVRYDTLLSVARAGTGHLGASLSCADLLAEIYLRAGAFSPATAGDPARDVFILSKGHAAPSHYAMLAARRYIPNAKLDRLRRAGGLPGHSHISVPGVDGNTGSLAMGLSRAVGFATARARAGMPGRSFVIVGDGELQEGQVWEALLSAAHFRPDGLLIVIDDNRVQTDQFTADILRYHDLPATLRGLGFALAKCDGHDPAAIRGAIASLRKAGGPGVLLATTVKGKGVTYMEHVNVLRHEGARYVWHNRPPNGEQLAAALAEILTRRSAALMARGLDLPERIEPGRVPLAPPAVDIPGGLQGSPLVPAFAEAVVALAEADPRVCVLDADLEEDCGLSPFRAKFPGRFHELGIMEQHMISAATAWCAIGQVPLINSYAAFLTSRSNEHIYNLLCDPAARFLLAGHLAGVIPATPGVSHQACRDIGCLRSIPGLLLYQPSGPEAVRAVMAAFGEAIKLPAGATGTGAGTGGADARLARLYLRMSAAPSAVKLPFAGLTPVGRSEVLREGADVVLISAGPVMLGECLRAAEELSRAVRPVSVEVRNHAWLAEFDEAETAALAARGVPVIVAEDHNVRGGLGEGLFAALARTGRAVRTGHVALRGLPETGFRAEALQRLGLGWEAIRDAVVAELH